MERAIRYQILAFVLLTAPLATAQSNPRSEPGALRKQNVSGYFDSIRNQPLLLLAFLREMPKGGDLHNHLSGSLYAENLIDFAVADGLCVDRATLFALSPPCDALCDKSATKPLAGCGYGDQDLYNAIIDAWSMRNWERGRESGHDHFFASFSKFGRATTNHTGDAFAQAARQAAADHLQYLELIHSAEGSESRELGAKLGWSDNFTEMQQRLLSGGLHEIVSSARKKLDTNEGKMKDDLRCGTPQAEPACAITVRFLYQVLRGLPPEQVFAQMVTGFELASRDSRFVGLNLVMPEDSYVPMRDFDLHMRMLDFLHGIYPKVHITLHAGELAMGLVPPDGLTFHIRESVERGHAERIGHGVDVMNEHDPLQLLGEMAQRNILVEICLTSNDVILGVGGKEHPFPIYRRYKVPMALATDDEGVSRSDLTHEYLRAVQSYELSYSDLKQMARQSLEHSFLPGSSLWKDMRETSPVPACESGIHGAPTDDCQSFLAANERARMQWKLEQEFTTFEKRFESAHD